MTPDSVVASNVDSVSLFQFKKFAVKFTWKCCLSLTSSFILSW